MLRISCEIKHNQASKKCFKKINVVCNNNIVMSSKRKSRKNNMICRPQKLIIASFILFQLIWTTPVFSACSTEDDLDFETCKLEDLQIAELKAICERVGLDVEEHIFPPSKDSTGDASDSSLQKEYTHSDYVLAAEECLEVEEQMNQLLSEDPEMLSELEQSMFAEDPALLSEVIAEVLSKSPDLMVALEKELMEEDPELYEDIKQELEEGQTFADRPDILADLVTLLLAEDPELLDKLDEDLLHYNEEDTTAEEIKSDEL